MTGALLEALTAQPSYGPALRRFICELAIAGRLLPQTSNWTEYCLDEIVFVRGGSTPSMARPEYWGGDVPWVSPKDMHVGDIVTSEMFVTKEALAKTNLELVPLGSVLIVGRSGILKRKLPAQVTRVSCTVNQDIKALTPKSEIESAYLRLWLLGSERAILAEDVKTGTTVQSLVFAKLFARRVKLPSTAVQRHIVAKVDELMALCDRLEAEQAGSEAAHAQLVQALLASLTQARDAADFRASWQQLAEHFHTLFTTETSIDALEGAVLTLAATGKFSYGTACADERTRYDTIAELPHNYERLQKQRITGTPLAVTADLVPLPRGWVYRSIDHLYGLNHIVDYADGNHGSDYPTKAEFGDAGVLFLTAAQIAVDGSVDWANCPRLRLAKAETLTKGWARPGDVLLTHNATVGRTAIFSNCPESTALLGTSVTFYRVNDKSLSNEYLYLFFSSSVWYDQMAAVMRQTTRNQVSITKQALFFVALPPLEEQLKVAAYVKPLREMCSQLRERLADARQHHEHLASVLVEQAVA